MTNKSTVPLLSNIRIDSSEKFELFKVTITDAVKVFDEAHVKIRGALASEAVEFLNKVGFEKLFLYQDLQENDWVSATFEMMDCIGARSVFLYFEDHCLVAPHNTLKSAIEDFEALELDFLCYSFFRASNLDAKNALPFYKTETDTLTAIELDSSAMNYLGRISSNYYVFSLLSLVSVEYFSDLLLRENANIKIHSKVLSSLADRLFRYPRYKKVFRRLNSLLAKIDMRLCYYHPSSPFNLEKMVLEFYPFSEKFKVGLPKHELYANYDDDNGAYGESLIKRGLYPFDTGLPGVNCMKNMNSLVRQISLEDGEKFDCTYYSHIGRINRAPLVEINVVCGRVDVLYQGKAYSLSAGESKLFYSNMNPNIQCVESSQIELKVFDEVF